MHSKRYAGITIQFQTTFIVPKGNSVLIKQSLPHRPLPPAIPPHPATTNLLFVSVGLLIVDIS